jgi:predicted AlkP superfamily phosphohydrolase/phosphomutase
VTRVAVIGLDSVPPQLAFDRFAADMPTLTGLRDGGLWGPLRSVIPPITVPAWSCMMSGRTPGELGIYGFRNRADHGYKHMRVATSASVRVPRVWDLAGSAGKDSVLLGIPGTYPPPPVRGCVVGDFLAPSTRSDFVYPQTLLAELEVVAGDYLLDIADFRSADKDRIAQQLFELTNQRFAVARHLVTTRPWDFFAMVDMAADRMHHAFWKQCDPAHPRYQPGSQRNLFRDYYRALDRHLTTLLEVLPSDTVIIIVSDHGAQPMVGGFFLNEWLLGQGLLVLNKPATKRTPIGAAPIDWSRTRAWGDGGYYGRVFLNVAGREPNGTISPDRYEAARDEIATALEALPGPDGNLMGNRAFRPDSIYPDVAGIPPDLIVYFADLTWRAVGTLGLGQGLYTFENDTGPDDANHADDGIVIIAGGDVSPGRRGGLSLLDIAPTVQSYLQLAPPPLQRGSVLR